MQQEDDLRDKRMRDKRTPKDVCGEARRRRLTSSNRAAIFVSTSCKERHNKQFWL